MARLGTHISPTRRDAAHENLGVQRANFQALLARRGVQDYAVFQTNLRRLNHDIQELRTGNPADLMARGNVEAARQDMQRFFNEFIARVETTPQGIHGIAQAINPAINIQAFERSPTREFAQRASQEIIQELREGNGPFDALRLAVEQSQNTDLYVLFSLYAAARVTFLGAHNPREIAANEARVQELERQRAYLTRVNDELAGAHRAFDQQETSASLRTWGSRVGSAIAGAAMAIVIGGVKLPSVSPSTSTTATAAPTVNVTVNVGTTITLGHSVSTDPTGNIKIAPSAPGKATIINRAAFQFDDVVVGKDGTISGNLNYQLPGKEATNIAIKSGENKLSDGSIITLKRVDNKLQVSYKGTTINY